MIRFQKTVWDFYKKNRRKMPWRDINDPYKIFVSEIMLQQTQVDRVTKKYPEFIRAFPNFKTLATAPLKKVLAVWRGMGYNRRALYLQQAAEIVIAQHKGRLPSELEELQALPGVGPATAASIAAFAFNQPTVFIETNIRSVFIHEFFPHRKKVRDAEILPLVAKTVKNLRLRQGFGGQAREWYCALMDYGALLKKKMPNPSRASAHHTTPPKFKGSNRELRGKILKKLLQHETFLITKRATRTLTQLQQEGLIKQQNGKFVIA